jgi:aldose 1-epimerase
MARAPLFLAVLCLAAFALASGADARKMVGVYVLKKGDFSVKISNWGATIMSIVTPDSKGTHDDFLVSISKKS